MLKDKLVAVLYGGLSSEREVSLRSGEAVFRALKERGCRAELLDAGRDLAERLLMLKPDVVFVALHGRYGEDGCVQGLLEVMGIPYTGSGVLASALAMNKAASKQVFRAAGVATAAFTVLRVEEVERLGLQETAAAAVAQVGFPLAVKAACQGSSIGTYLVREREQLPVAIEDALRLDRQVVLERLLTGPELTAALLGNEEPDVLPLIEIVSETGRYDYQAKYTPGLSRHLIPAPLGEDRRREVEDLARRAYRALGCRGFARVDIIVDRETGPQVLEVNTVPGLTEVSLFPDAARAAGMSMADLVERILELALAG